MKRTHSVCLAFLLAAVTSSAAAGEPAATREMALDGVVAYVGERAITVGDAMRIAEPALRRMGSGLQGDTLAQKRRDIFRDAVQTAIARQLILNDYEKNDNKIPDWAFQNRADGILSQAFGGDREKLLKELASDGLTYEEWMRTLREQMIVAAMRREHVDRHVRVSPADVRAYYEKEQASLAEKGEVHVRRIVISAAGTNAPAARQRAEEVHRRAKAGEDFVALAKAHSQDAPALIERPLVYNDPARELKAELAKAVLALEPGQVSPPVEVGGDYYILKLELRKDGRVPPFEEVQEEIERTLRAAEAETIYRAWVQGLRRKAHVREEATSPF
jgi:parvulin-like peptidyl-prolyl isomerase